MRKKRLGHHGDVVPHSSFRTSRQQPKLNFGVLATGDGWCRNPLEETVAASAATP